MDATLCNVIYVDDAIQIDRVFRARSANGAAKQQLTEEVESEIPATAWESKTLEENICLLADVFGDVHLCGTGSACMAKLFDLQDESMMGLKPTIVLIGTPHDERIPLDEQSRSPSPHSAPRNEAGSVPNTPPTDEVYGLRLLRRIVSEAHLRNLSKLIVPVSVIKFSETEDASASTSQTTDDDNEVSSAQLFKMKRALNRSLLKSCLKLGATDVLFSPIQPQSITSLEIRAYWAHKSAARDQQALLELRRGRKRSWVGIADNRPFAYLRENMVASLMRRICQMEEGDELPVDAVRISVTPRRKQVVASSIGNWHFSAHDYDDDELVEASALMFRHALSMPELAEWRIPTDQLVCFLIACRAAYNSFVPYHNFRHVVDVLQATFNFLVNIGAFPPYSLSHTSPATSTPFQSKEKSPMASLIHPFEALTLLITAIGHDVGHPGVNNGFLIVLNTPLAQLYNDRSVLESFHCAAYSQILRRYWPAAFNDSKMRNLMTSSILATDMGLHFDYMKKLGNTQDKLAESNTTDGWNGRMFEDQTALACALLIKCADISNVARRHDAALQWMHILSDEFSRQAFMENQLAIKSSLVAPPKKDNVSLFRAQLGFMNMFAIPLFQGIASIMPAMQYCVDELEINKAIFERAIAEETAKATLEIPQPQSLHGAFSPRTMSLAVPNDVVDAQAGQQLPQQPAPSISANGGVDSTLPSPDECAPQSNGHADNGDAISPKGMPALGDLYKEQDGTGAQYDTVAEFAASDPFGINDGRPLASSKQRVSEATDGSTSLPGGGDWASQATSATTGKMPLSPSTQGTSIISRDSMERPSSLPAVSASTSAPNDVTKSHSDALISNQVSREDGSSLSSGGVSGDNGTRKSHREEPFLKKKSSRFRMNAFTFFRRHLSPSPPLPTSNPNNGEHVAAQDSCR